jgi:hypothetical protein
MKDRSAALAQGALTSLGRSGAGLFAISCAERLRPLLQHVPSGAPPLVAGIALTELWRVLEGAQRPDPRRLSELSQACWVLVDIEPTPKVPAALLELLLAATHHSLETYIAGNPQQAILAAEKSCAAAAHEARGSLVEEEVARQDRDIREIADFVRGGSTFAPFATRLRKRAEKEGGSLVGALLEK